ncbi:hypothetical protein AALP_AA8G313400 [Arabis alpina]|uniref:Uncharacterized protein n=1 Tax=Arabis alpina TaxID=50452 RepID=A0A087GAN7_ARAAL|nr:hypothetical protein AALP_AA8G313400 [Arabis alpina]
MTTTKSQCSICMMMWIQSVMENPSDDVKEIFWRAKSAPIHSHEAMTPTPKQFDEEELVPDKLPPLRDRKFAQILNMITEKDL